MKNETEIQLRQALMMLTKVQNEAAFYKSQTQNCVSVEEYNALKAERDSLLTLYGNLTEEVQEARKENVELRATLADTEARLEESEAVRKKLKAENRDLKRQISDLQDTNALLTADKFGPSSEVMERLFGKHTEIPSEPIGFLAMLSHKGYDCDKSLKSPEGSSGEEKTDQDNKQEGATAKKRNPRGKDRRPRAVWVDKDSIVFDIDDSNLPRNAKIVGTVDDGVWTFRLLYIRRMKVFSAAHRMARFNVPGEGQMSSRYPDTVFEGCHLTPSFLGAYHRFKFQLNVSEQNFLRLLKEGGCDMQQSSLNQMMHADMSFIRGKLEQPMVDEIKASPFTHNDETRLSVKYVDKTGNPGYHDGYVHGILSPSARLVWMTYEEGSRRHGIQEKIIRDSQIRCFTSDKARMYQRIIKDIGDGKITVGYCWGHGRREMYHAYQVDRRLKPVIELIGYLFDIERQCDEGRLYGERRRQKRHDFSRPVVDMFFSKLRAIVARPKDFGQRVIDACNYFLNDEDGFRAFLDNGLIALHNNPIESCFRHIAVGRETWQHCGGHKGAENIAFIYGLEQSCRLNCIDYGNYIEYVHERLMAGETDMRSLLPNHIRIPVDWVPEGERIAREIEAAQAS